MFKAKYCGKECQYLKGTETNKGDFCDLGHTQNPATVEGIMNVIGNKGHVCARAKNFLATELKKREVKHR